MAYIWYNAVSQTVSLQGTAAALKEATCYLKKYLADLWRKGQSRMAGRANQNIMPSKSINSGASQILDAIANRPQNCSLLVETMIQP